MASRAQIPRWILALVTLLTGFVGMAAPLTSDGLALLHFRSGLTVISPALANWNASHATPCSWGGISCTGTGRVRNISLSAQVPALEGSISSSLGKLNLLEGLMLDQNMLSGRIPPELGNSSSLRMLVLSSNTLTGQIPPQLGNCSSLVQLWLDGNMLSGNIPESLGNLKHLGSLNLAFNLLTGEIPLTLQLSFAAMTNLSYFSIGDNLFSGSGPPLVYKNNSAMVYYDISVNNFSGDFTTALDDFSKLPAIGYISAEDNNFRGTLPPSIGNATSLYYLGLGVSGNGATLGQGQRGGQFGGYIPREISKLVNLEYLQLGTNNFTGDIPLEIWNMTSITFLDIGEINMKGQFPIEIGNMRSLQSLILRGNELNGTIPPSLGELTKLISLDISRNTITGSIPNSFTSLTNLKTIALGYNNLTGSIPTSLYQNATSLEHLLIQGNSLSGPLPHDLGRFTPNLTEIGIDYNAFNGTLPDGLCQGGKLYYLVVNNNSLHGAIPMSLASCTSLTLVGIADNQFNSIPEGFGRNSSLEVLHASHNQLTGQLPLGLGINSHLASLDLSENKLTGSISVLEFSKLAQNLSILNLAKNNFSGEIPAAMGVCKLLFSVDLSYNFLTGVVPPALATLDGLQELYLQNNNLTMFHPSIYSGFSTKLRILNLAENSWNAPIAFEIGSLRVLHFLNMSHGGHIGQIPSTLGQLTQLEVLDLSHNNLTGEVPSELGESMTSLTSVNVSFNQLTGSLPPAWVKFLLAHPTSFLGNPGLCLQYDANNMCKATPSKRSAKVGFPVRVVVGVVLSTIFALALVVGLVVLVSFRFWRYKPLEEELPAKPKLAAGDIETEVSNLTSNPGMFTYEEIMKATEDLSDKYIIGRGGHGIVYKVDCASGMRPSIVVKKVSFTDKKTQVSLHKSFWSEIKTVGKVRHRNIVRLLGFIKRDEVGLLLYDYVSNGDLQSALQKTKLGCQMNLNWEARLHIARGVAHGLAYLHHDYGAPIVHRDIKSSNVLLDNNLEAHISDFGLAKVMGMAQHLESKPWLSTQNVLGTLGYIAPEAAFRVVATPEVDVYSFGVLLLELLTGKEAANDPTYGPKNSHVVSWVKGVVELNEGKMSESVLDPSLLHIKDFTTIGEMVFVLKTALMCTLEKPAHRPTMRVVENMLETFSHKSEKGNKDVNLVKRHVMENKISENIDLKENKVETQSNIKHGEGCNENGHDCWDRNMVKVPNINAKVEVSKEHESFWSEEGQNYQQ